MTRHACGICNCEIDKFGIGMTLRDYFAAAVINGMVSDSTIDAEPEVLAEKAYVMADAMLKAREAA